MADDDVWARYAKRHGHEPDAAQSEPVPPHLAVAYEKADSLIVAARLPDPATIAPRPWLYGTQLLRGYVSVLVAPGGTGKSAYAMALALSLATNRELLGDHIFAPCNVAVLNLEDPMDELERRLAALMILHRIERDEVDGRYFMYSSDMGRVTIAAMSLTDSGYEVVHPDEARLIREIVANNIGLLVVDPYAESHELEENSNPQMIKAAAAWRRVARATGCAILLVHHVRKGTVTDIDSARGAKALTDSARVGLLLSAMSEEEAEEFGVNRDDRTLYVRIDNAKANMAPRAAAKWFHLETVELDNATETYPAGDRVGAIERWKPPGLMDALTTEQCNKVLDEIDSPTTLEPGERYTHSRRGKTERWAGQILVEQYDLTERKAGMIIHAWMKEGLLISRNYSDGKQRKERLGLYVEQAKRPGNVF